MPIGMFRNVMSIGASGRPAPPTEWVLLEPPYPDYTLFVPSSASNNTFVMACHHGNNIERSSLGGANRTRVLTDTTLRGISFGHGDTWVACSYWDSGANAYTLRVTRDNGDTWTNSTGDGSVNSAYGDCFRAVYLGGGNWVAQRATGVVVHSSDDAITFDVISNTPVAGAFKTFIQTPTGRLIGSGYTVPAVDRFVYYSDDGGLTWSQPILPAGSYFVQSIRAGDGLLIGMATSAAGSGIISVLVSYDDGDSFIKIDLTEQTFIASENALHHIKGGEWVIGYKGSSIIYTDNNFQTHSILEIEETAPVVSGFGFQETGGDLLYYCDEGYLLRALGI